MTRRSALVCVICTAAAAAQPDSALEYGETATGLALPEWDGGRTQLVLRDVDVDGNLDIVSVGDHGSPFVNTSMHGTTIWFGDGAGAFSVQQTGMFGYGGVDVADANNDGLPDVAFGVHHDWSSTDLGDQVLEVALGDGSGTSWTPWDDGLGMDGQSWGMFGTVFADADADGWLDVASVSFGCCDGVHLYLSDGDGSWTHAWGQLGGNSKMDIRTGDVNNDGYPDFVTAHQIGTVWLGDGGGGLTPANDNLPPGGSSGHSGPDLADVNRDGLDDIAFANPDEGIDVWIRQPGGGWFERSAGLPEASGYRGTRLADMDGDGFIDVVALGGGLLTVWLGDGGTSWTEAWSTTLPSPGSYEALAVGDVDRNGRPDIAIVTERDIGFFSDINELHLFIETSTPPELAIRVTAPPARRVLRTGAVSFIGWVSGVPAGAGSGVALELSTTGPTGPWEPLASGLPDNGRHQLILPEMTTTDNAYVRATVTTANDAAQHVHGPLTILGLDCPADCNGDGMLNIVDFVCFQGLFAANDPAADCNGDGMLNVLDFVCYQSDFEGGCQ